MELENLLQKLIDMGRVAFGKYSHSAEFMLDEVSLDDICGISSGLWQFVCEKILYKQEGVFEIISWGGNVIEHYKIDYWLMLSSVSSDKSKFLLENIVLPD